ncbi:MAG: hypothetical protein HW376_1746 [candidate division NC10 bacterium]|nr:hypothetical protein [candidate division NC10 bacterium]
MNSEDLRITVQLNDRAQPIDRGDRFEDPLNAFLLKAGLGEITGGGTQLGDNGEVVSCEIEVRLNKRNEDSIRILRTALEKLGAPKGSRLLIDPDREAIPFGSTEGLGVYLNGTDLPDATYRDCDSNFVYSEFNRLLQGEGSVHSHWEGPTETALYVYGKSYETMERLLSRFIGSYPLCEKARVVRIARGSSTDPGQPGVAFGAILVLAGRAAPPRGCFPTGRCAVANLEAVRRRGLSSPCRSQVRETLEPR